MDFEKQKLAMEINNMKIDEARQQKMKTIRGQFQVLREESHDLYRIVKPIFRFVFKAGIIVGAIGFTLYVRNVNLNMENRTDARILADIEKERILNSQKNS